VTTVHAQRVKVKTLGEPTPQGGNTMTLRTYEITINGEAEPAIRAAFDDFDVSVSPGTTTLTGRLMDQAALHGVIDRLQDLHLELLKVISHEPEAHESPA
jgi:hypothetical protein